MKRLTTLVASMILCGTVEAQVSIDIDANVKGPKISPTHYGIFYEDINHAADGGLYAELIRNRSFEDDAMNLNPRRRGNFLNERRITAWSTKGDASIALSQTNLLNEAQSNALSVNVKSDGGSLVNEGFWGINAVKGRTYKLSFWARSDKGYKGNVTLQLTKKDATPIGTTSIKASFGSKWKKYTAEFTATGDDPQTQFVMTFDKAGEFQLDMVSLFPPTYKNRPNGMRPDLAEMLEAMHPRFMRFPGGCFVEGQNSPDNAFRWKRTIGPIEERPGHLNVNWGYRTSDGIGFHEYLQLAEDIGAKPLFVVNVGIWHGGCTPYDSIQGWIEECLDALEYANGDVTTKYGKMRAANGHPKPFGLEYIEIGNENYNYHMDNNSDQSDHYPERYIQFYNAIKAKYPYVHCIGNVESWSTDDPSWRNNYPVELVDEHYYRNPKWFADRFNKYDTYDRNKHKVYVGEYAVTSQFGNLGNLNAALGEAVYMMGMENNSDVVVMNSYAPIFVNENDARWRPDMIRFSSSKVMGTPSYYVQQLFPNNIGTQVIKTNIEYQLQEPKKEEDKRPVHVGLATWGTNSQFKDMAVIIDGKEYPLNVQSWKGLAGHWSVTGEGTYQQAGMQQPAMAYSPFDISAKKYTFKTKAMKVSGAEGFMIMVGVRPDEKNTSNTSFVWYNVGGWDNSQNNVEQGNVNGKSQLGRNHRFVVEPNRWYDVQIDVDGDNVKCYIDGRLDYDVKLQEGLMKGVYASTTYDEATDEMIVKVVNVGEGHAPGTINFKNFTGKSARLIRLSSASGDDENTLDNPFNISPKEGTVRLTTPSKVEFEVPAYSVNIIRVKK